MAIKPRKTVSPMRHGAPVRKKTPAAGRIPVRAAKSPGAPTAVWVILAVAVVAGLVIMWAVNHNRTQDAAIQETLRKSAEEHAAAKAHNEKVRLQIEEEKRLEAEQKAAAKARKKKLREQEEQRKAQQQEPAKQEPQEVTPRPEEQETPQPEPVEEEPAPQPQPEEEPEQPINLAGKVSDEHLARFQAMVNTAVREKQFDDLRSQIGEILQASFPEAEAGEDNSWHNAKVKSTVAKRALAMYRALHLAAVSGSAATDAEDAFLTWLISAKGFPAGDFINGIDRHKVSVADAAEMMDALRRFYAEEPKRAAKEIRYITNPEAGGLSKKLYPVTKKDQQEKLKAILATKAPKGVPAEQQEGVNTANAYRYLCGIEPYMVFDKTFHKEAQEAAEACRKAGRIAHDLGGHTDQCNLFAGLSNPARCVKGYIEDPGGGNRENRGHRAWILDPAATKTAFGVADSYGAMRVMDFSGNQFPKNGHSYPGRGFFPADYLHGTGWSYYPPKGSPPVDDEPEVEMWKLPRSAKSTPTGAQLSKGRAVPILAVFKSSFHGSIVFEPDYSKMNSKNGKLIGAYWVRISWKGFKTEYVVDLY